MDDLFDYNIDDYFYNECIANLYDEDDYSELFDKFD